MPASSPRLGWTAIRSLRHRRDQHRLGCARRAFLVRGTVGGGAFSGARNSAQGTECVVVFS